MIFTGSRTRDDDFTIRYLFEDRYISDVSADDENVFFYVDGGFAGGSGNYLLVPFESQPFRDSIRNGLFGSTWTVRYTVFDIEKNKAVFDGLEKRGGNYFVDAVLMASPL